MRNYLIPLLFLSLCLSAYAQTTYRENIEISGGYSDADGGMSIQASGDLSITGTLKGDSPLVIDSGSGLNTLNFGGSEVSFPNGALYPATDDTIHLGIPSKRFSGGYFEDLDIDGVLTLGSSSVFEDDFTFYELAAGIASNADNKIVHKANTISATTPPGYPWTNPTTKEVSNLVFSATEVDESGKGEGNIEFYVAPASGAIPSTPQLSISGDDDVTVNVALNAEGGVFVGGTEVISPASADQILYANVNKPLTAKLDFSAPAALLVDADITDTLTIGSSGDLSAPPAIGGTTPATGAFTVTTTPEITSATVMDLKSPSVSGSDAFRFGYGDTVALNDTKVSFFNNTTEQVSIDLYDGDLDTVGDITSTGLTSQTASVYTTQTEDITIVDLDTAASRIHLSANGSDILQSFYGFATLPILSFIYANGTSSTPTIAASADALGRLFFQGYDGTDYETAAYISATVDGTPGTDDMPGALGFYTTPDGSDTPVLAMKIDNAQDVSIPAGKLTISDTSLFSFDPTNAFTNTTINSFGNANNINIQRAQGTQGSETIVGSGHTLAKLIFNGYDGSTYQPSGSIRSLVNTTPGAGDMPGRLSFWTTPNGTATEKEEMRIFENETWIYGDMEIGSANTLTQTETTTYGQSTSTGIREYKRTAKDDGAGNPIVVTSGQFLERMTFQGWDGANWRTAAEMIVIVDGTAGVADMPGEFRFYTTPDGTSSASLSFTISNEGNVIVSNGAIISGSTTIVNSSNEILVAAMENSNSLTATDTWISGVQTDNKGVILDQVVTEPVGTTIVSGASQTVPVTSKYMELSAISSASISTFSGADFEGQELIVLNTVATAIVLFDSTGNIDTLDDTDITLNANDWAKFFWDGDEWREINHKT